MSAEDAAKLLRRQALICGALGSSLYHVLLDAAADDLEAGGPAAAVVPMDERAGEPEWAMPLRLMAAVHRLVLTGRAPGLAAFFPSAGGTRPIEDAPPVFLETLARHAAELPELIAKPCQTNEVGRCAGLILGFLEVAERFGKPLRLLEIGASAGLNLRWDRFRYESGDAAWGPAHSPVVLKDRWSEPPAVFANQATVAERLGCDPNPIDPTTEEGALAIRSSVWADQTERFTLLEGALKIARDVPAKVERSGAGDWLERMLAKPVTGVTTLVYHSVVWQYIAPEERDRITATIHEAGGRATEETPMAWLRMEPEEIAKLHSIDVTTWPGEEQRHLAISGPHGDPVTLH